MLCRASIAVQHFGAGGPECRRYSGVGDEVAARIAGCVESSATMLPERRCLGRPGP